MAVWAKIRRQARHLEDGTRISALHRSFSNRVEYQRDASASKYKNAVNSLAGASCWYGQVSPPSPPRGKRGVDADSGSGQNSARMDAANRLYHSFSGRTPGMNSPTLTLHQLLPGSTAGQHWIDDASANGAGQVIVTGVTSDSRRVTPGDVFVAVAGTKADGHQFVQQAVARGAVAVVSETPSEGISVPQYITDCSAAAFARMCMRFNVGTRCPIVCAGITGTNGKTTASWMLRSILQTAGLRTGMVGTIECDDGVECSASEMTTPTADALAAHMRRLMEQRATHSVLEISSHALVQKRTLHRTTSTIIAQSMPIAWPRRLLPNCCMLMLRCC